MTSVKDAIEQDAPPSSDVQNFQTGLVATIAAGHALHDTYTGFLPPLLPAFIESMALSNAQAGLLSLFLRAPSLFQPVIGNLADRVNMRYVVVLTPAVTSVMMSLLGVAPGYIVLALFLTVAGFSSAGLHSVAPVMAGNLSGRGLGRGMGFWMVGGELGRTLGPIVIVTAINLLTLRGTPWLMLFGLAASAVLYFRLRNVPVRPANAAPARPWRYALRTMRPLLAPMAGIITIRALMNSAVMIFLPTFLTGEGASLWLAGASLSLLEAAGVVGALTGGSLSDRLGRRRVVAAALILSPLAMVAFLNVAGVARIPVLLLLGFSTLSIHPSLMALVQESFPENRALANGIYGGADLVINSIATLALGAMGDMWGLTFAFYASAAVMLLGLPLLFVLPVAKSARAAR
jgi:FSR family fosmidomycin resistance protein-like MFS transporter